MAQYAVLDADGFPVAFYDSALHREIPPSAMKLTPEQYQEWKDDVRGLAMKDGKLIAVPANQRPDPTVLALRSAAYVALKQSDTTILRCYENGVKVPPEWGAYRAELRSLMAETDAKQAMPHRPPYPAGT